MFATLGSSHNQQQDDHLTQVKQKENERILWAEKLLEEAKKRYQQEKSKSKKMTMPKEMKKPASSIPSIWEVKPKIKAKNGNVETYPGGIIVEDVVSDSEDDDRNSFVWCNRRPSPGEWIEPVERDFCFKQ
mmetsp:Transcript_2603/g.3947  ORF Transcript_2603/g.3947 Transcript_2603/m.3947 type:complete len:131 (-) Transcript_2603:303-695(-)